MSHPIDAGVASGPIVPSGPMTGYQRRLLLFLSVATFFEGYDFFALAQILPQLSAEFGLTPFWSTVVVAAANAGTVLSYWLVRKADLWGRRRVMTITILGYTLSSLVSGLAPNAIVFGFFQLCARTFLIAEWAVAMVYAAEEFPAARRGMVIGVIQAMASLGSIVCAGVVPLLLKLPFGWRSIYFVGALPLVIIAFARRNLQETARFSSQAQGRVDSGRRFTEIFYTPYWRRVLQLALIWFVTYICTQNAITFFKVFAMAERGMTDADVAKSLTIAAVGSMPLLFGVGKLLDVVGRRWGAVIIFTLTSIGVYGAYSFHDPIPVTASLVLGIFGASAVLPVLNAYTTELFPTEMRSDAFAWSNNLIGRIGYVLSPLLVGATVEQMGVSWGAALSSTAIFPLLALGLIWLLLPETGGKELEETCKL